MSPRRNPLDPFAFDTEPRPFVAHRSSHSREEYLGTHTTSTPEQASCYAVQRAALTGDSIAIVFELDVAGLRPLRDVDATIQAMDEKDVIEQVKEAIEDHDGDVEAGIEYLVDSFEGPQMDFRPESWLTGAWQEIETNQSYAVVGALRDLDPEKVEQYLSDGFPDEFWMSVVDQRRFLEPIGLDRVSRILALRPIRNELWGYGDSEEEDGALREGRYPKDTSGQPQIFTDEDFIDGHWLPDYIELYNSGRTPQEPQYHGTDLTRASRAFPELNLQNPWGYTQEPI